MKDDQINVFLDKWLNKMKKSTKSTMDGWVDGIDELSDRDKKILKMKIIKTDRSLILDSTNTLKNYFNKRLQEEHIPDEATLISIVKNPYPGKFVTEVSYDDAVRLLKDEYGYDDSKIDAIKAEVAKTEDINESNIDYVIVNQHLVDFKTYNRDPEMKDFIKLATSIVKDLGYEANKKNIDNAAEHLSLVFDEHDTFRKNDTISIVKELYSILK